jgi:ComF family protein
MAKQLTRTNFLKDYGAGLLHLFYPRLCEGCNKSLLPQEELLCIACEMHLAKTSYHHLAENETSLRLSGRVPFVHASSFAYFSHDSLVQHLVLGLKYREKKRTGIYLGSLFGLDLRHAGWKADAIIPVPLHPKKEALRGYNQSMLIAKGIGKTLGVPVIDDALIRNKATETQTDKSREERAQNVTDAFLVAKPGKLEGKHLLLVDDVITTGATVESCALAVLSGCNNVQISVATIAIAVN